MALYTLYTSALRKETYALFFPAFVLGKFSSRKSFRVSFIRPSEMSFCIARERIFMHIERE